MSKDLSGVQDITAIESSKQSFRATVRLSWFRIKSTPSRALKQQKA